MSKNSTSKTPHAPKSQADWNRLDAMRDEAIDTSDSPELTAEQFENAMVRKSLKPVVRKQQITLPIDEDVLDWFKVQGTGYQTKTNELLHAYVEAQKSNK